MDERKDPVYQPCYIRGICLQKMGKFEDASKEYAAIVESSHDEQLQKKSKVGLQCCALKQSSVPTDMLTFSAQWEEKGSFDFPSR
ncbi:MAG: hypothetical protein KGS72_29030 [Cyanobacteria bacterium REEB67]|nr:hypothetical protein [Cyanobacteria bacterium REEB67]